MRHEARSVLHHGTVLFSKQRNLQKSQFRPANGSSLSQANGDSSQRWPMHSLPVRRTNEGRWLRSRAVPATRAMVAATVVGAAAAAEAEVVAGAGVEGAVSQKTAEP
jgi:hypothetical protein